MATTTETAPTTNLATTSEIAAGVAQFLTPAVVDLQALVVNGKQAHWHVRGVSFAAIHELLDGVVDHAQEYADLAAERVIALGLPVDARLATVAKKATLPAMADGFTTWEDSVKRVVEMIDAALVTVRAAIKGLDDIDLSSQDIAIEIEQGLTKDRWLLHAHVAS